MFSNSSPSSVAAQSPRASRTALPVSILLAVCASLLSALPSCNVAISPDKRVQQYLNQYGFGKAYTGNAEEENYVSIGDEVAVLDTLHSEEIFANQRVDIDGTVLLPELGSVHVAGMTRSELRAVLSERYANYYAETDIQVSIRARDKVFFIFGEVNNEGEQPFEGNLTIFEAVMGASPDDSTANLGRVRLIRADPVDPLIIAVNVNDLLERGDSTFNVRIQENDIIYVPPTLVAQFAYFLDDLLFPVRQVLSGIGGALFGFGFGLGGGGRRNNNFNNQVF